MSATVDSSGASSVDPTQTATLRSNLSGRLTGAYGKINAQIREDVIENDIFGTRRIEQLAPPTPHAGGNYDPETVPPLARQPLSEQVRRFREWLDSQQEQGVRGPLSRSYNPWLTRSYNQSITNAEAELRRAGYGIESIDATAVSGRDRTLDAALSRFDDRLTAAINDTTAEAGTELQEGLEQEVAASVLAAALTGRINHSNAGKNRVRNIAHGSIVRVANEAALDRYEAAGAESVSARVESSVEGPNDGLPDSVEPEGVEPDDEPRGSWMTAGDFRVCPQCRRLAGQTWRISDIRAGRAPMPVRSTHGFCRCWLTPVAA